MTVTLALGTTAPCWSSITPEMEPVTIPCENANVALKSNTAIATVEQILSENTDFITFSPRTDIANSGRPPVCSVAFPARLNLQFWLHYTFGYSRPLEASLGLLAGVTELGV